MKFQTTIPNGIAQFLSICKIIFIIIFMMVY